MKNQTKLLGLIVGTALLLNSCMTTTHFDVIRPADVDVPSEIATFAVVQRNEAPKGKKLAKRWEGLLSGEGIGTDKRSAGHAVSGLIIELSKSSKYTIKQATVNEKLYGTGTIQMGDPLDWAKVEEICKATGAEALIVVEAFDSDVDRNMDSHDVTRTVSGGEVREKVYDATVRVTAHIGWRIYFPKEKEIIDVYKDQHTTKRSGSGVSEGQANRDMPRVESLVQQNAQQLGVAYARRISPTNVKVARAFYGKGSAGLKLAKEKMLVKDYDAAIEIWDSEFQRALDKKVKKKTSFNLAVGYEAKADYENAVYWAKESIIYGNKNAIGYLKQLEDRVKDEARLKEQLKESDRKE